MKKPNAHPIQGEVPPIEHEAETLEPLEPKASGDAPMPTAENEETYLFVPANGISTLDVAEIVMMRWLVLTGQTVNIEPGALRNMTLPGFRVDQLSPEARKQMRVLS